MQTARAKRNERNDRLEPKRLQMPKIEMNPRAKQIGVFCSVSLPKAPRFMPVAVSGPVVESVNTELYRTPTVKFTVALETEHVGGAVMVRVPR